MAFKANYFEKYSHRLNLNNILCKINIAIILHVQDLSYYAFIVTFIQIQASIVREGLPDQKFNDD